LPLEQGLRPVEAYSLEFAMRSFRISRTGRLTVGANWREGMDVPMAILAMEKP
jgi:hypothetical protein